MLNTLALAAAARGSTKLLPSSVETRKRALDTVQNAKVRVVGRVDVADLLLLWPAPPAVDSAHEFPPQHRHPGASFDVIESAVRQRETFRKSTINEPSGLSAAPTGIRLPRKSIVPCREIYPVQLSSGPVSPFSLHFLPHVLTAGKLCLGWPINHWSGCAKLCPYSSRSTNRNVFVDGYAPPITG